MNSTHGVQHFIFFLTLHGIHEEEFWSSLWKTKSKQNNHNQFFSIILRKRWPSISWKVCFNFFFFFFQSVNCVYTLFCVIFRLWRHIITTLYHCANSVQVGVKSYCFPFHILCICVIHGVFKSSLSIIIFMYRASCILCFRCSPVEEKQSICNCSFHNCRCGLRIWTEFISQC